MKLALPLVALVCAACSSSPAPEPAAPAPAEPTATEPVAPAEPDIGEGIAWAEKSHDQKKAFMKLRVVPAMQEVWKESPEPDATVNCMTCHGQGVMEGKFDMPNPDLPKLGKPGPDDDREHLEKWGHFMGSRVVPTMVKTLGVAPYDPATHQGFGCMACHTAKAAAPVE